MSNEAFGQEQERAIVRRSELRISTWGVGGHCKLPIIGRTLSVSARSQGPFHLSICLCSKNTPTLPVLHLHPLSKLAAHSHQHSLFHSTHPPSFPYTVYKYSAMDPPNRSRSSSVNRQAQNQSALQPPNSQSQSDLFSSQALGTSSLSQPFDISNSSFTNQFANSSQPNIFDGPFDFSTQSQGLQSFQQPTPPPHFDQQQPLSQPNNLLGNQFATDASLFPDLNTLTSSNPGLNFADQSLFPPTSDLDNFLADPSSVLDPRVLDNQSHSQPSTTNNMMASITSHPHNSTPPHLLSPAMQRQHSTSPHGSPAMLQGPFQPPNNGHSRNASLDPSSAQYLPNQAWSNNDAFRHHRRLSSGAHSEASTSAHPSPFLTNQDSFDGSSHSPLLNAVQDPALYNSMLPSMGQFSISDPQQSVYITPGHSPHISPALLPNQSPLPAFSAADSFALGNGAMGMTAFPNTMTSNNMFNPVQESFPALHDNFGQGSPGQADVMTPPEFKIDLAPPSRQPSFEPPKPEETSDGLHVPNSMSRTNIWPECLLIVV